MGRAVAEHMPRRGEGKGGWADLNPPQLPVRVACVAV